MLTKDTPKGTLLQRSEPSRTQYGDTRRLIYRGDGSRSDTFRAEYVDGDCKAAPVDYKWATFFWDGFEVAPDQSLPPGFVPVPDPEAPRQRIPIGQTAQTPTPEANGATRSRQRPI